MVNPRKLELILVESRTCVFTRIACKQAMCMSPALDGVRTPRSFSLTAIVKNFALGLYYYYYWKMVNYWKSKVLPKIKKVFENPKKAAAAEACKTFDEAKEQYAKECEDKKAELQPKVIEIYEASSTEIKTLVKEPKDSALKKHSAAVQKFLDELAKIEFPGSKPVCEAASKIGPGYLPGPVFFVLEKVSTFVVTEEKKEEAAPPAEKAEEETSGVEIKPKEIVVEQEKEEPPPESASSEKLVETPEKVEDAQSVPAAEQPKP
ncbi:UNVERIFIED_CONTAM: Plasma membrane-associated cation-binding protein 1 [Sesamum angustifolium]|uniref:Plasma membrane-associated cation-binding protein 1 n=1 Tax=Sesamum angustifolium TaxID=2727405 RepID=A0AAW2JUI9_9LAMI